MPGIDNRKDILLLLLYVTGPKGEIAEPISGRTRLMKLLYLLSMDKGVDKALNIKKYYDYVAYDYGPFSKDVFEDIQFLRNVGLLESNLEESSNPVEQWEDYQLILESVMDSEKTDIDTAFQEETFSLTDKGKMFVEQKLLPNLPEDIGEQIESLKVTEGSMSLTALLNYVYTKYPKSASKSRLSHLAS